jgi:hypothetical protein
VRGNRQAGGNERYRDLFDKLKEETSMVTWSCLGVGVIKLILGLEREIVNMLTDLK